MHSLTQNIEIHLVNDAVANASNTDDNSARIDMADYESATFIVPVVDSAATGVAALTVEASDADTDCAMAAINGATATLTCAVNDDINGKLLIVEVRNPPRRFIQAVITSAVANIAFGATTVLLTPRRLPVVDHSTVGAIAYVSE
ncbi:hypothetical protein [Alteraurantiacibacter palmitatis]|uniref:Uncharacterized protein n=1 Tax=Alteraurantiacibacter palmitatis TaxID=2054628 RepID=A0ABV7E4G1_9SPHN